MSKNRPGGRKRRPVVHRARPARRPSTSRLSDDPSDLALMRNVRDALADPHPFEFLALASSLVAALDRPVSPFGEQRAGPTLDELLITFLEVDRPETTALLTVIGEIAADDLQRARIKRELATRRHGLPSWLDRLDSVRLDGASEMRHVQQDGDNVMVGFSLGETLSCTAVVYIDHNLGTLVKDAFVVPDSLAGVEERFRQMTSDVRRETTIRRIEPADARTRIREAIDLGAMSFPPFETDTWPASRPLVEWIMRMLPEGGRGYDRPELSDRDRRTLINRFLDSPYVTNLRAVPRRDQHDLVDIMIDYSVGYGTGDPLHWSPVAVELVLHWIPQKVHAAESFLAQAPDVLRAFLSFCHAERRLPRHLTEEALDAVDRWEPTYRDLLEDDQTRGPLHSLLSEMGPELDLEGYFNRSQIGWSLQRMDEFERAVGGAEALARLSPEPLPDEPFNWAGIDVDRDRVAKVLALCDQVCEALLDVEHRTACRRFLAEVVRADPQMLIGPTKAEHPASSIVWVIGRANGTLGGPYARAMVKDLTARLGPLGNVSERGYRMLTATGRARPPHSDAIALGTPDLLVAAGRARILADRDRVTARIGELGEHDGPSSLQDDPAGPDLRRTTHPGAADLRRQHPEPRPGLPEIQFRPGMADELLREAAPLLAEEGIDLERGDIPDLETLQRGLDRAVERLNMARFTPVGTEREAAAVMLRRVVEAIAEDDSVLAGSLLEQVPPVADDETTPTVSACIGLALGRLDDWLSGDDAQIPAGVVARTRLPSGHWSGARAAADILLNATERSAFGSLHDLIVREGGKQVLHGSALALAAAVVAWSAVSGRPVGDIARTAIR